jgi:hypothetical protein
MCMRNNYGLPSNTLDAIRIRDKYCVYCKKYMLEHNTTNPRSGVGVVIPAEGTKRFETGSIQSTVYLVTYVSIQYRLL